MPVLTRFRALEASQWAESLPSGLDASCRDLVAMLVASCVRYFRRCVTSPIMVAQSSNAMTALDKISAAFGQREIFPLNQNVRKGSQVDGVHGYPFLAAGPRQAMQGDYQSPYIHLADQGYQMSTSPSTKQAAAAGRAAQFCLRSVIEWCLKTGGEEYREVRATSHHRSLLREGRWLIENVCQAKKWEVSEDHDTAIEELLAQIPYEEACQRMTLVDERHEAALAAIADEKVISPAVRMLPAIKAYYGQEPDVTVIAP